jgi:hypothetical protein
MADGTTKPIEDIKVGDVVKSRDLQTGRDEDESVVQTYEHPAAQVMSVSFADGESFTCTPDHRVIVAGKGIEPAGDLASGDKLFFGTAGTSTPGPSTTSVTRVTFKPEATTVLGDTEVYNFEVANTHTYFVGKINGGVWVHNDCRGGVYKLLDELGNVMRTGRTNNLARREAEHQRAYPDLHMQPIAGTDDPVTRRGLEQMAQDEYNAAYDLIRGIAPDNPNYQGYMEAAQQYIDAHGVPW